MSMSCLLQAQSCFQNTTKSYPSTLLVLTEMNLSAIPSLCSAKLFYHLDECQDGNRWWKMSCDLYFHYFPSSSDHTASLIEFICAYLHCPEVLNKISAGTTGFLFYSFTQESRSAVSVYTERVVR